MVTPVQSTKCPSLLRSSQLVPANCLAYHLHVYPSKSTVTARSPLLKLACFARTARFSLTHSTMVACFFPSRFARSPKIAPNPLPCSPLPSEPLFTFGLVADIQYARRMSQELNTPDANGIVMTRRRAWRESVRKLTDAVRVWNMDTSMRFVVSLGDIVEGSQRTERDLFDVLRVFQLSRSTVRHVVGNHCRRISNSTLLRTLGLSRAYYTFTPAPGWRVIVLDTSELCGSAIDATQKTRDEITRLAKEYGRTLHHYHGAVSPGQLKWLAAILKVARINEERVLIMSHYPLAEGCARETHVCLNGKAVMKTVEDSGCDVVAVFAGHDHLGGWSRQPETDLATASTRMTHITLPAMMEAPKWGNAFATVRVYANGILEVLGYGTVPSCRVVPQLSSSSVSEDLKNSIP